VFADLITICTVDQALRHTLVRGVSFIHAGLSDSDRNKSLSLFKSGISRTLVVPHTLCWALGEVSDA
jgi:hypothetical protein